MGKDRNAGIHQFFEADLPILLPRAASSARGSLCFVIDRVGAWTVTLGLDAEVASANDLDADLVLYFSRLAFSRLLTGDLVEQGSGFAAHGDASLLSHFTKCLAPAATDAARMRAAGRAHRSSH